MSDLGDPSRESLAAIVSGLVERHGGPTKVAALVDVERTAIHRWMKGDVSIQRLALLANRLDESITVQFGHRKSAAPEVPERLETVTLRLERVASVLELLEAARKAADEAEQELDEQQSDAGSGGPVAHDLLRG